MSDCPKPRNIYKINKGDNLCITFTNIIRLLVGSPFVAEK